LVDEDVIYETGGLLGGLTAWHFRLLTENPWNGGGGYDIEQVACWSLDQVWFRLAALDLLGSKGGAIKNVEAGEVVPDEDGFIHGVTEEGEPIKAEVKGISLCRRLMEEEMEKEEERKQQDEKKTKTRVKKKRRTL